MNCVEKTAHFLNGVGDEYGLKVITVFQSAANACCDGVDVFQYGAVFDSRNVIADGSFYIAASQAAGKDACFVFVGAGKGAVGETFQSHFFCVAGTCQYSDILGRHAILFREVLRHDNIVIGDDSFDGGNDELILNAGFQLFQVSLQVRGGGDRLMFINCRFLGNQDTIYTGSEGARLLFTNCYIEGTTDFIFGPSTALFEYCELHSKRDSYITAASTPQNIEFGYVFKNCKLTAAPGVKKVYLGRPWRPYAATAFINCEFGNHIRPEGWHNWKNPENEKTARYAEFGNTGEGAKTEGRVAWTEQLTKKEVLKYTPENIFKEDSNWYPYK